MREARCLADRVAPGDQCDPATAPESQEECNAQRCVTATGETSAILFIQRPLRAAPPPPYRGWRGRVGFIHTSPPATSTPYQGGRNYEFLLVRHQCCHSYLKKIIRLLIISYSLK